MKWKSLLSQPRTKKLAAKEWLAFWKCILVGFVIFSIRAIAGWWTEGESPDAFLPIIVVPYFIYLIWKLARILAGSIHWSQKVLHGKDVPITKENSNQPSPPKSPFENN